MTDVFDLTMSAVYLLTTLWIALDLAYIAKRLKTEKTFHFTFINKEKEEKKEGKNEIL
jgi:hypothetical protein